MNIEGEIVFEVLDYEGVPVILSRETWQAKAGNGGTGSHPEIGAYLEDVRAAIGLPDLVFQSTRDERSRLLYRLGVGHGDFAGKHLVVVIKYVGQAERRRGYISTIYLSRAVYSRGLLLWPMTGTTPQ
jgi:hypothetical protein